MHQHSSPRRRKPVAAGKLSLALGLCLCAGQLVNAPAASAAAPTASAAVTVAAVAAAAPVTPRATIAVTKRTINRGSPVTLSTQVTDPRSGRAVTAGTVHLQAWRNGRWNIWQTKRVNSSGRVSFTSKPLVTGGFRTLFTGASGYRAVGSPGVKVTVNANVAGNARVVALAKQLGGSPYRFGAAGPRAFDCSGFTQYVFKKAAGKNLPHNASAQQRYGRAVSQAQAQPGDLIVMAGGGHAGIYAGGGYMYDAPRAGTTVGKHKIWSRSYVVRRIA